MYDVETPSRIWYVCFIFIASVCKVMYYSRMLLYVDNIVVLRDVRLNSTYVLEYVLIDVDYRLW